MIIDNINHLPLYPNLPNKIKSFLEGNKFKEGRNDIERDNLFAVGLKYQTKDQSEGLWEAHRKYLDIHYIIDGEEIVHLSDINLMSPTNEYQDDYQLFEGTKSHEILLKSGDFMVLYPHEVHKTSIIYKRASNIKKYVFKVLIK